MVASAEARFKSVENRRAAFEASERAVEDSIGDVIQDAQWVVLCFDVKDLIRQGYDLFKSINSLDEDWRALVYDKTLPYDAAYENRITNLYRACLESAQKSLAIFDRIRHDFCALGHATDGIDELRSAVVEMRGILTPDDAFFAGPTIGKLEQEAICEFRKGSTFDAG